MRPSAVATPAAAIVVIVVVIVIGVRIRQRIPIVAATIGRKYDHSRRPPASHRAVHSIRCPDPTATVVYPASVMVGRPSPGLIIDPRPSIRCYPTPLAITVRRPVGITACRGSIRPPDVTVFVCVDPLSVAVQVLGAVNVLIVVRVVMGICE